MKWEILSKLKVKDIIKILLTNRGLKTKKQVEDFLEPKNPLELEPEDFGISKLEIKKAVERIKKAVKNKEHIIVYGDYDSDGICGTAILWETLYQMSAKALPYIPDRITEGYGFNTETIQKLKTQDPELKLFISVDHGITAHQKIKFAKNLGIDVIVTDHHEPAKTNPQALAVVHTQEIAGVDVAWVLAKAVGVSKEKLKADLALCALGTVGDVMPVVGENRGFIKYGIEELKKTGRPGLLAIYKNAGLDKDKIGTYEIGYIIDPRLNAKGRMEHAIESLRLLCTKNLSQAGELAKKLEISNEERQLLLNGTVKSARELHLSSDKKKIIFLTDESFHFGVVGLVAGRLAEEFYRPAIVVSKGKIYSKASARSINGFNIIEAIRTCSDLLVDAGGHPMAAGFTIETAKLEILKSRLEELAEKELDEQKLTKTLKIDCELFLEDLSLELYQNLSKFEPFGIGNPEPVFVSRQVKISEARTVGAEGKHLKLRLTSHVSPITIDAIGFGIGQLFFQLPEKGSVDIAYNLTLDKWNNQQKIQLKIKDIKWQKG